MKIPDWLLNETFVLQHNPNCTDTVCVRLTPKRAAQLGLKPYAGMAENGLTKDICGFGKSVEEAAENARNLREKMGKIPKILPI